MTKEKGQYILDNRILVVEDDKDIREGIAIYLKNQGYDVLQAGNGFEALEVIQMVENNNEAPISLAVLDVMMPKMDGMTFLMKIRDQGIEFPVIMLTAKSEEIDKVMGLNMGADDYITKPFTLLELSARINSQLRRYQRYSNRKAEENVNANQIVLGDLVLDEEKIQLTVSGKEIKLTPMEYRIVQLLMKHPGKVYSTDEIYESVWSEKAVNSDTIMVHVRNIREKIEADPKNPKYLKVVWGVGYKMDEN